MALHVPRGLRAVSLLVALSGVLAACGDDDVPAPPDAAHDLGADDALDVGADVRDTGPACEPGCAAGDLCCASAEGVVECIDPRSSIEHCGRCGYACTAARGESCERGICACGDVREGCLGTQRDTCCQEPGGGPQGCRNLDTDPNNCGACGQLCDVRRSSGCRNGACECGDLRGECAGTAEATCCTDATGVALCRNLLTSRAHCGACNFACPSGFSCLDGVCSLGDACSPRCAFPDVCCRNECCDVSFCRDDGCTSM